MLTITPLITVGVDEAHNGMGMGVACNQYRLLTVDTLLTTAKLIATKVSERRVVARAHKNYLASAGNA